MRKSWLPIAGTSLVAALAAWLSLGSLAVVEAAAVPRRVGLLPSWWWLPALLVLAGGLLAWQRRVPRGPLLASAFLLLPWLPLSSVPAPFFVWVGPIVHWSWLGMLVALGVAAWPARWNEVAWLRRWTTSPRHASALAWLLAFVLFLAGARLASIVLPAGDEPHYLVITQSLLQDGDLRIENNHRQRDYRQYYPGAIDPDFLRRGTDGEIYSIHAPGLPALVLPAFALGGYPAVVLFLAFVSALGTWLLWRTAFLLTGSAGAAWFGWAAAAFGTPFFFHAFTVFPDGVAATIVIAAVHTLVRVEAGAGEGAGRGGPSSATPDVASWLWLLMGALLAALPWLHTRYAVAAAILGVVFALRLLARRQFVPLALLAAMPLVSAACWFGFFYVIYGEFNPAAPYGSYTQTRLSNLPAGLLGLLFDQQFGIVPNAPAYAFGLLGFYPLIRRRPRLGGEIAVLCLAYLSVAALYHMWWGGYSAPARFAVPMLLLFGLPAASFWHASRSAGRAAGIVGLVLGLLITGSLTIAEEGELIFNDRDGFSRWMEWVSPLVDLPRAFPSVFRMEPLSFLAYLALWVALLTLATLALARLSSSLEGEQRRVRLASFAPLLCAATVMCGCGLTWAIDRVDAVTPSTAQLRMLRLFDEDLRPVGLLYRPLRLTAAGDAVSKLQVSNSLRRPLPGDYPMLLLANLPPGDYRVPHSTVAALRGRLEAFIGRSPQPVAQWRFDGPDRPREVILRLPSSVDAVVFTGDEQARRSVSRLALQPVGLTARPPDDTFRAARAARYDETAVFSGRDHVFLEEAGVWTEGGVEVPLAFATDAGTSSIPVLLRNGAVPNRLHLSRSDWSTSLDLAPGQEQVLELPVRAAGGLRVDVKAERGFRPADVEPASRDQRYLGVWLQPLPVQKRMTPAR